MASPQQIKTVTTELLGIKHPIFLAGMSIAAGPELAAAVTNAGGLGVVGGLEQMPDQLREQITRLKGLLRDKNAPFGVDLLVPQIGGNARKTNHDYTKGKLDELIDIIIESGAKLFVAAVGVPPKHVVEKLHANGVLYMNMIGHPKHVKRCIENGADLLCPQGGEGGGHTGDIPTTVLLPTITAMCRGVKGPSGHDVQVLGAGGLFNGQSLAAALMFGASAVWIGTRFVLSDEAGAPTRHKEAIRTAGFDDNVRTLIFTGRPIRVRGNRYVNNWENNRQAEMKELCDRGDIPVDYEIANRWDELDDEEKIQTKPLLMGKVAGAINEQKPAKAIIDEMVNEAVQWLQTGQTFLVKN